METDTPVVRLENLDIRLQAVQSEHDVASSRSELLALDRRVREDELAVESDTLLLHTSLSEAERRADVYKRADGSFVSALDTKRATDEASGAPAAHRQLAEQRLALVRKAGPDQLGALRTQLGRRAEVSRVLPRACRPPPHPRRRPRRAPGRPRARARAVGRTRNERREGHRVGAAEGGPPDPGGASRGNRGRSGRVDRHALRVDPPGTSGASLPRRARAQ